MPKIIRLQILRRKWRIFKRKAPKPKTVINPDELTIDTKIRVFEDEHHSRVALVKSEVRYDEDLPYIWIKYGLGQRQKLYFCEYGLVKYINIWMLDKLPGRKWDGKRWIELVE